jgi:hypothetical protein
MPARLTVPDRRGQLWAVERQVAGLGVVGADGARRSRKLFGRTSLVAVLAIALLGLFATPSHASAGYHTVSHTKKWTFKNNPMMFISVDKMGSRGSCITPAKLSKVTLRQYWAGYGCSFNPQLSVSVPFGVSFGAWPSCGKRKRAKFSTTYGKNSSK